MRPLSLTAINQYRKNAKNNKDLDIDILKIRIYCLTCSCNKIYPVIGGTIYQFGTCKIKVNEYDIVVAITWDEDENLKPTMQECKRLEEYYLRNGLNKNGTRYATKAEIEEFQKKKR